MQLTKFNRAAARQARGVAAPRRAVRMAAGRPAEWLPGSEAPAHLDGKLPGDYGFDPIGLGSNPDQLRWFAEAERVHARWAMLATAGILAQEIFNPRVFWYEAAVKTELPFNILGLVAAQIWMMHFVEVKRWQDFDKPGSVDQDPLFKSNKLPAHEVGYPGGQLFDPLGFAKGADVEALKLKEIKNGRLAMLGFVGFVMSAQVTGLNPLAALSQHLEDPMGTTIFSKAVVIPGQAIVPACKIAPYTSFQGIKIPTPCFANALWP